MSGSRKKEIFPGDESPSQSSFKSESDDCDVSEEIVENLQRALALEKQADQIKFRWTDDMSKLYKLGDEIMPSGQGRSTVKAVLFASRRSDGKSVIVKLRNKTRSFKDDQEITDWVSTMKLLYHISGGEKQQTSMKPVSGLKHLASVVDIVEDTDNYYCVMDHISGRDMFDYFVQEKIYEQPYKLKLAREIAIQIIDALIEFHGFGLVHKDLKLENIVLDEAKKLQTGPNLVTTPMVIDFDTVEVYRAGATSFHVLGTDQYIAPETYAGFSTPNSDMWAVGVVFYTILTGSFPFHYALFDDQPGENYVGHPRMDQIRRRMRIARLDWSNKVWSQDPKVKDFVRRCFTVDQKKRMTASEARIHPWLAAPYEE